MDKLNDKEIKEICELYKQHGSLRQIAKIKRRSLSTLHKYTSMHSVIKTQNIVKRIANSDERFIGTYVGLWMGDGTQYNDRNRYTIKICSNKKNVKLNKFVQDIIYRTFGKRTRLMEVKTTNQAYIIFKSKFIYSFIKDYSYFDETRKTYTVKLKKRAGSYNLPFLKGCLLGLVLSDGYLKDKFAFNVTSSRLAKNMLNILKKLGYLPHCSITMREKEGFKNLYSIRLGVKQSNKLRLLLDRFLLDIGVDYSFKGLKYEYCEKECTPSKRLELLTP